MPSSRHFELAGSRRIPNNPLLLSRAVQLARPDVIDTFQATIHFCSNEPLVDELVSSSRWSHSMLCLFVRDNGERSVIPGVPVKSLEARCPPKDESPRQKASGDFF